LLLHITVSSLQILACETNLESSPSGEQRTALLHACNNVITCQAPFNMQLVQWNEHLLLTRPSLHCRFHPIYCTLAAHGPDQATDRVEGSNDMPSHSTRVIALHFVPVHTLAQSSVSFSAVPTENIPLIQWLYSKSRLSPQTRMRGGLRYHPLFGPGGAPGELA